jgi:serine/threonine protein kinase
MIVIEGTPPPKVVCPSCGSTVHLDSDLKATIDGSLSQVGPGSPPPQTLGKFELLELLGSGSFGDVYKARDTELDRLVALKIPRAANIPRQEDLDRFLREAKSVAQLKHPGIVALYDAGTIGGAWCLVSEFIQGATLVERPTANG